MIKDLKKVKKCVDCNNKLKKNNKHHFRCEKCWLEFQILKNNGIVNNTWLKTKDTKNIKGFIK